MRQPRLSVAAADPAATEAIGAALAAARPAGSQALLVTLAGELGAGKTTLARAMLRRWGAAGPVRSPTYTLVEPYELDFGTVFHFDLYRLAGAQELEAIGYRELRAASAVSLLEWPERGAAAIGVADVACRLEWHGAGRRIELGAGSPAGDAWIAAFRTARTAAGAPARSAKED